MACTFVDVAIIQFKFGRQFGPLTLFVFFLLRFQTTEDKTPLIAMFSPVKRASQSNQRVSLYEVKRQASGRWYEELVLLQ